MSQKKTPGQYLVVPPELKGPMKAVIEDFEAKNDSIAVLECIQTWGPNILNGHPMPTPSTPQELSTIPYWRAYVMAYDGVIPRHAWHPSVLKVTGLTGTSSTP